MVVVESLLQMRQQLVVLEALVVGIASEKRLKIRNKNVIKIFVFFSLQIW